MKRFEDVVDFHGHACPGLALGYRVSIRVLSELGDIRARDEEIVAIVENDSCAVDAIQVMTGCTFGKGTLIFRDYGKQVYTFIMTPGGEGLRIAVDWNRPEETGEEKAMWERYRTGDRSEEIVTFVHDRKSKRIDFILHAADEQLLKATKGVLDIPAGAKIYPSVRCELCGEKVMEPRARIRDGRIVCIPCSFPDK